VHDHDVVHALTQKYFLVRIAQTRSAARLGGGPASPVSSPPDLRDRENTPSRHGRFSTRCVALRYLGLAELPRACFSKTRASKVMLASANDAESTQIVDVSYPPQHIHLTNLHYTGGLPALLFSGFCGPIGDHLCRRQMKPE